MKCTTATNGNCLFVLINTKKVLFLNQQYFILFSLPCGRPFVTPDGLQDSVVVGDNKAHLNMNCQAMRKRTVTRLQTDRTQTKHYSVRHFQKAEVRSREGVEELEAITGGSVAWGARLESNVDFQERS